MMVVSFRLAMGRPAGLAFHLGWLLALLPLHAAGATKLDPDLYPPPDTFRSLQLAVLACGRENTAAICEKARVAADPLLDHPRLPSVCKDVLWNIRQKAVVGAANDDNRRDQIEKLARDVNGVCSQMPKPKAEGAGSGSGGRPGGQSGGLRIGPPGQR